MLRAVSQQAQGETNDPSKRSAMRIYVEKEGDDLKVVLSESFDDYNGCVRFLLRCAGMNSPKGGCGSGASMGTQPWAHQQRLYLGGKFCV